MNSSSNKLVTSFLRYEWRLAKTIPINTPSNPNAFFANPIIGDLNADRRLEILIPSCSDEACTRVSHLVVVSGLSAVSNVPLDLKVSLTEPAPTRLAHTR